jgi:hypothetical protein
MISMANSAWSPGSGSSGRGEMTVVELAIFLCAFRGKGPMPIAAFCPVMSDWFECAVRPADLADPVANMLRRGWLVEEAGGLRPSRLGRCDARHLLNGIIRMLDHGTRLIDVALMMSVLRLTKGELDAGDRRC